MEGGFEAYIEMMANDGAWGGNMENTAMGRGYDCPIVTLGARMRPQVSNKEGKGSPISRGTTKAEDTTKR